MLELLPLVGIALLFWLFIIRPASRRQKELGRMQSSLSLGDEIVLTSGVYGTVRDIEDGHVLVEIASGVTIKVVRGAVGSIATKADVPDLTDDRPESASGPEES
ncbi:MULTISPECIES: preprotein translocase subunit YajC [unclassified Nocardioides]|uniref:preprotein translocase subunit YajC n=1 Tax=unclassified Nocardioides TaxID=2615069 RepID=UPI0000570A83|nr:MULTISPECIES: preprotein translocase subunit YajC [unclassified Nocardioides]ABL81893.1 protein translocase subunit yajC [Nocardioides sp. JS614]